MIVGFAGLMTRLLAVDDDELDLVLWRPDLYADTDEPALDAALRAMAEIDRGLSRHGSVVLDLADHRARNADDLALWPELFRVALAYGIHPLTGVDSPAGRWRVRNVVRWHPRPVSPAELDLVPAELGRWARCTRELVIVTRSARRYFDLDRVRFENARVDELHGVSPSRARGHSNPARGGDIGNEGKRIAQNPNGAPPHDTIELDELAALGLMLDSMVPPKVCRICSEPSRRIPAGTDDEIDDEWSSCECPGDARKWRPGRFYDPATREIHTGWL